LLERISDVVPRQEIIGSTRTFEVSLPLSLFCLFPSFRIHLEAFRKSLFVALPEDNILVVWLEPDVEVSPSSAMINKALSVIPALRLDARPNKLRDRESEKSERSENDYKCDRKWHDDS
jgi:hypothetical protein